MFFTAWVKNPPRQAGVFSGERIPQSLIAFMFLMIDDALFPKVFDFDDCAHVRAPLYVVGEGPLGAAEVPQAGDRYGGHQQQREDEARPGEQYIAAEDGLPKSVDDAYHGLVYGVLSFSLQNSPYHSTNRLMPSFTGVAGL